MSQGPDGASSPLPGYTLGRRIGRGGFAVVHEATQESLGRLVAVKMLSPGQATSRDLHRFERERLLLADLSRHRHVVDVIDAGSTTDGQPFIVMRLYRRGSLAQQLADTGPLSTVETATIVAKLAGALQAAHNLGVIHRDVKPENVLIGDDGEPALADFGIAVLAGGDRTTGNSFTMGHAAPEIVDGGEYGVSSDIYSLASTAYTLLAGHTPFQAENYFAQLRAVLQDPVPAIGRPDVPPAVGEVLARGLAKRPQDRFRSVIELADALTAAVGDLPSLPVAVERPFTGERPVADGRPFAPEATATSPGGRRRRGRRLLAGAGAAILAVIAVVAGTALAGVPPGSLLAGGGSRSATVLAIDLSLQGVPADKLDPTVAAVSLYLEQLGHSVNGRPIAVRTYDIGSAEHQRWDGETCQRNARLHLERTDEVAVIGPYNSGCAKLEVPILNQGSGGPMLSISNGSTDPGLTRAWDVGEPGRYYPTGQRNFARVVTTDDVQGAAAARYAVSELGARQAFVLDDGQVYGSRVAQAFAQAAAKEGLAVVGGGRWDRTATSYRDLFTQVKYSGADTVFLGGTVANNGLQLVRDKVAVLGPNSTVSLLAADGFAGSVELAALGEAQGMYVTFPGRSPARIRATGGAGSAFLNAFQQRYGADPPDPYALYGVAAVQVVVQALEESDGTREGLLAAIFTGDGVTVPKATSVLGADTRIDPATGDVSIKDVTVEVIKRRASTFETVVTLP